MEISCACTEHKHLQSQLVSINLYRNIGDAAPLCIEVQYPQYNEVVTHRHPQYQYHHGRQSRHRSLASWTVSGGVDRDDIVNMSFYLLIYSLRPYYVFVFVSRCHLKQ